MLQICADIFTVTHIVICVFFENYVKVYIRQKYIHKNVKCLTIVSTYIQAKQEIMKSLIKMH